MSGESLGFCKAENLEKILVGDVGTYFSVQETQTLLGPILGECHS